MKQYKDSTLMGMTKKDLLEQLRTAEHNQRVTEAQLNQHIENVKDWLPVRHGHIVVRNRPMNAQYIYVGDDGFGNIIKRTDFSGTRIEICSACMDNPVEYCSECGARLDDSFQNYCPRCGAKMDEVSE